MSHAWISLLVFVAADSLFVILPNRRSITACAGGLLLVPTGVLGWREAFFEKIGWNVMGLFFGTLILAEMFMRLRVPAVMAKGCWTKHAVHHFRLLKGGFLKFWILFDNFNSLIYINTHKGE